MVYIKEYAQAALTRIKVARDNFRNQHLKRQWIFAEIGGGSIDHGRDTKKGALSAFTFMFPNSPIKTIDESVSGFGVIIHGTMRDARND